MLDTRFPPPLSPVPLLGAALPPGAERLLAPAVSAALHVMHRRHRPVFERLAEYAERRFLIDPIDLPFAFLLMPRTDRPRIQVIGPADPRDADVTVRGPLAALLTLLEGRADGDALFFSRQIAVEGDTAALVALRNAVDGEGIDLVSDLLAVFGPLAPLAGRAVAHAGAVAGHLAGRLVTVAAALLGPLDRRIAAQARALAEVEARLAGIERGPARRRA